MRRPNKKTPSGNGRCTSRHPRRTIWLFLIAGGIAIAGGAAVLVNVLYPTSTEAPEAARILELQASMPFQILIPGYLPRQFKRGDVEINVSETGPGGEPMVQLAYRTRKGATLFVRQWIPVNPEMEVLASSRPIHTKWGRGWMLSQGESLIALWVDVGPLRASLYTSRTEAVSREQILAMADSLGPASNRQVFSFVVDPPRIEEIPPPPPVEIPMSEGGIQELTLVVTPGGYSPLRFAVKKDVPVRLHFRQLGQVGCGNELILPVDPRNPTSLFLTNSSARKSIDFTPRTGGDFQFFCSHQMYRGVMRVRE
jgi:hypothetical protein